ncbi:MULTISPECIES: hypothetical protein [unclassified Bradyrhizobium]|uniref:hypothetical protein n=1 Tax=unclassified Bradyrhizobium TaxID=2631580 RepID=UPI001CD70944|nr:MULTISPECIES: hypothetical protein [unclassified Bradyrhizobium]MCA1437294.1 hypothetical protein [Bradyrhizobium sp. BRP20]MCA1473164.1 hypothetical protein [Bradyrhizobium sp. IC3195]MCA1502032.1 hypothetical protein [Bradyrhizobium sp. NBAIM14]MCA1551379.1 hypothetical protein [Bradyrhizobium sp. BRP19]
MVSRMRAAYKQVLYTVCVKDGDDPLTEMIAKEVIKIAQTVVGDPTELAPLRSESLNFGEANTAIWAKLDSREGS